MPNEIDLSENNLLGRRAIAKIVAPFEPVILPPSPCEDAWHVRNADGTAVIRCYGLGNRGNDKIARMLAAHIATNSPEVFIAYTDEILRLRAEVERLEREIDYLVQNVRKGCPPLPLERLPDCDKEEHPRDCAACWRGAARKAVEGKP